MSIAYDSYLQTDRWRELAGLIRKKAEYRCQLCASPDRLEVHHRTYARVGCERIADLICLCHECHTTFHTHRKLIADSGAILTESKGWVAVGMARAQQAREIKAEQPPKELPSVPGGVLITAKNCKGVRMTKETYAYMIKTGVNPKKSGWARRLIGHTVPHSFFKRG